MDSVELPADSALGAKSPLFCLDAEVSKEEGSLYVHFQIRGDASDCFVPPPRWSVTGPEVACLHDALQATQWDDVEAGNKIIAIVKRG